MQQLQRPTPQPFDQEPLFHAYEWCKARLRQSGALGSAEVRRFLHDRGRVEGSTRSQWQQLRNLVGKQLSQEIAHALRCHQRVAERLIITALTAERPIMLPTPPGA